MIRVKVRRIPKRIQGIAFFVSLTAIISILAYLRTRTVFDTFIIVFGFLVFVFGLALISATTTKTAKALGEKTRRASREELEREDDVLLQAVAFSQSVFFIYLNLIPGSNVVTAFKILVPIFAVLFYALRAWGKIKDDAKYRYWSIWLLFFIMLNTIFMFVYSWIRIFIVFENVGLSEYFLVFLPYLGIVSGSMKFIEEIFKKRYGYR